MTMMFSKILLMLLIPARLVVANHTAVVGDAVCAEGIAMDLFCIERGTLFDNPGVVTLEGPDQHSVLCLIEVPDCAASPYEVLLPPQDGATNYSRGYRLDDAAKADLLTLAKRVGVCSSCDGNGTIKQGLTIVVQGQVVAVADGDTPPTVSGNLTLANPSTSVCSAPASGPTPSGPIPSGPTPAAAPAPMPTKPTSSSMMALPTFAATFVASILALSV